ncbi:crossover junction endodeoxyribonuclease RuvC [Brevibacillus laterosporus]|uniref:crossover junction endodeoxyribonuclease RuvC n=1 Tax=Brevibacillus laterosporus TaxID=1465 RepID=UPI003D1B7E9E
MSRFLLAFDPSLNGTGYAVLDISHKKPKLIEKGTVKGRNKTWGDEDSHQVKLSLIIAKTRELVAKYRPAHKLVFLEKGFSNKYINSTQIIFKARGALESQLIGFEIIEIAPTSVKKILAEHGHAHKKQVAECVADFLGIDYSEFLDDKGKLKEDESDATAVGVAGWLKYVKED